MRTTLLCALLAGVAALACSTLRVSTDYDPKIDFGRFRTYAWLPDEPTPTGSPRLDSPLLHERIRTAIDRALEAKGFARTENPDFLVRFDLSSQRKLDVSTYNSGFYRGYGYWMSIPQTEVREYEEGSLIIDVIDQSEKKVVWRGIGQRRLRGEGAPTDPAELQKRADEVAAAVLKDFPPSPAT
jgi:hypothetical protein